VGISLSTRPTLRFATELNLPSWAASIGGTPRRKLERFSLFRAGRFPGHGAPTPPPPHRPRPSACPDKTSASPLPASRPASPAKPPIGFAFFDGRGNRFRRDAARGREVRSGTKSKRFPPPGPPFGRAAARSDRDSAEPEATQNPAAAWRKLMKLPRAGSLGSRAG